MMVEGEPITKQDGSYPMHSKEFQEAAARGMEKHEQSRAEGFRPEARIRDMEGHGVDAQVIYPTVGGQILGKEFRDTELLGAVCRAYNDWSLEYASLAPEQLRIAAMLPMQAPDLAIEEAKRTADAGAACFYLRPNPVCGRNLYHAEYDPLWSAIERSASRSASTTPARRTCLPTASVWTRIRRVTSSPTRSKRWSR